MKKQLAMIIDSSRCIDCKGCVVACKVENEVPAGFNRNWIKSYQPDFSDLNWMTKRVTSHFQPGGCMHCENPTCVHACPTGATYKDEKDGTVKVNRDLCIGCESCVSSCPYGARYKHPELKIVDKCNYCEPRTASGMLPACVDTCPTKARVFGDINDAESEAGILFRSSKTVQVVNKQSNTAPHMYYINDTAPTDWPVQVSAPTPIRVWENAGKPLVWAAVGVNAAVVLGMLGQQFINRKNKVAASESTNSEDHNEQ